jgi:hypothetical protein
VVRRSPLGVGGHYGLGELLTEDFQWDRTYGTVRVVNPFAAIAS